MSWIERKYTAEHVKTDISVKPELAEFLKLFHWQFHFLFTSVQKHFCLPHSEKSFIEFFILLFEGESENGYH